jgi:hypothetical protein
VKRLLTIGFALSGLLLIAWPFDVFAMLHGISPHIQLATIVAKLKSPAPEVLKAIEGVANLGGTAKIRAEAQSVLAAANLKNAP